ncbi:hypothetical protein AOLI_G00231200 [Acnodon oligacanthus]
MDSLGTVLTPSDSYAGLETVETNTLPVTRTGAHPLARPVLRKRSRSPTPQSPEGENMVEKGSDHSSDKSPSTPEQAVQRTYSQSVHTSTRSGGKNSKKSQSWYNRYCAFM